MHLPSQPFQFPGDLVNLSLESSLFSPVRFHSNGSLFFIEGFPLDGHGLDLRSQFGFIRRKLLSCVNVTAGQQLYFLGYGVHFQQVLSEKKMEALVLSGLVLREESQQITVMKI